MTTKKASYLQRIKIACSVMVILFIIAGLSACCQKETTKPTAPPHIQTEIGELKALWVVDSIDAEMHLQQIEIAGDTLVTVNPSVPYRKGEYIFSGFDPEHGQRKWDLKYESSQLYGMPGGGYGYFRTYRSEVFIPAIFKNTYIPERYAVVDVDARSGKELRRYDIICQGPPDYLSDDLYKTSWINDIAVSDKYLIIALWQGEVRAYDRATGKLIWDLFVPDKSVDLEYSDLPREALSLRDDLLIDCKNGRLTAISCDSGEVLWRKRPFSEYEIPTTLLAGELCIAGGRAFDSRTGEIKWINNEDRDDEYWLANGVTSNGRYFGMKMVGHNLVIDCVDLKTGSDIWTYETPYFREPESADEVSGVGPVIAHEVVYFISHSCEDGKLIALDLKTGRVLCKAEFGLQRQMGDLPLATDGEYIYIYDKYCLYKLQMKSND
ncbi:MAG: PQQ-like beta-propeller repeat protein [Actinobacteria bacterium]|nr:PQQ-like beta-propeller repeat protein [Actinomycetota bacterium]